MIALVMPIYFGIIFFFRSIFARKIQKTRKILPYFCVCDCTKIYNYTTNIIKV